MTTTDMPVVRLTSPGEIASAVPHLCGFVPSESLVAVSLRGERKRIGLTLRLDLLPSDLDAEISDSVAGRLAHDGASAAVLIIYTDRAGHRPYESLVRATIAALEVRGINIMEALHVREDMWSSFTCDSERCCPAAGTPMPVAVPLLAAAAAFDGRAVLRDRSELVASLTPPALTTELACQLDDAATDFLESRDQLGKGKTRIAAINAWRCALTEPHNAAALAVSLQDVLVRDEIATWALDDTEVLLTLLLSVASATPAPYDVSVCTLVALVAWVRGDGALANVALDRALTTDPDYSMAKLFRAGLDGQLPPSAVKSWLRQTKEALT